MFDSPDDLQSLQGALVCVEPAADDADLVGQVEALERIASAAAAAQARLTAELAERREGWSEASIGAEVGLARHQSPHRGRRLLGLARALVSDLPHTLAALQRGDIDEHRAMIIAEETRHLSREDRLAVDAELADSPSLPTLGDVRLRWAAQRVAMRVDQEGLLRRREKARARRHVSSRSLPDGMSQVSAVLPQEEGAAIMHSLEERASMELATGVAEGRSRGQLVADAFVGRLTGLVTSTATPVAVHVVMSAETLLGDGEEPAELVGHGPLPASVARAMVAAAPEEQSSIRRLFRLDATDRLVAMDSAARRFTGALACFLRMRDQICRTPWCNARIRHLDHVRPAADGGATAEDNAQGLCAGCNYLKELPGWSAEVTSDAFDTHCVELTSPTGARVSSLAPAPPRGEQWLRHPRHPDVWVLVA